MSSPQSPTEDGKEPFIRVARGTPTPEELAALVGVVLARSRPAVADPPASGGSRWVRSARPGTATAAGLPARPRPDAWRASALPGTH